jgi:hypothetical protein
MYLLQEILSRAWNRAQADNVGFQNEKIYLFLETDLTAL